MESKKEIFKAKLLRFLRITRPIKLSKQEVEWVKLCKGHYKEKYRTNAKNWIDTLKPMFDEIYGWSSNEHYDDFLDCMFNKLLDLYLKIQLDQSGSNQRLKEIINAASYKSFTREYDKPIERCIAELCGQIQCNQVVENGVHRYKL